MAAQALVAPLLPRPDVLVAASPSFPALLPAVLSTSARSIPWVLWLHDILPDGAAASGLVTEGSPVIRISRRLERAAYRSADRIVVLSRAFTANLVAKGVPEEKIELIYDPATRVPRVSGATAAGDRAMRLLSMGNIGFSQGLTELMRAFEQEPDLCPGARIIVAGNGMAAEQTRAELRTGRVEMLGLVDDDRLEEELRRATVALVTQKHDGSEFNIPSKLMNFMAYGLPILAAVNPEGEVARIVRAAGAGWVVDSSEPGAFPRAITKLLANPADLRTKAGAARAYAEEHFTQRGFARRFDATLREVAASGGA